MKNTVRKRLPKSKAKIRKAQKSYNNLFKEVEPFIKKKTTSHPSTAGQWKVLSYE